LNVKLVNARNDSACYGESMQRLRYVRCDVFSSRPLGGNPLAVFTDARGLDANTMQALALEMNLSESVFVLPATAGGLAKIRIFTPRVELAFAGHPVLGAAFVLARPLQTDDLLLETGTGNLNVHVEREGADPRAAWVDLPLPEVSPFTDDAKLLRALGVSVAVTPILRYTYGITHILVQLENEADVARLAPDYAALATFGPVGIVAFAQAGPIVRARVFVPGAGVPEDPATGSAVSPIATHLYNHAKNKPGKLITISQGREIGRPSELKAALQLDGDRLQRVSVGGECVLLGRGEWQLPGHTPG
jgi:trans-2,3-dihydro-3-hydroxyanthranilate isomerase